MLPSERSKSYTISRSPCSKRSSYPSPNEDEALVSMRAASLKNIDRMMADGSHYDSHRELPSLVGVDATIRLEGSDSDLEEAFAREAGEGGYDVGLDYLWGRPTEALVAALTGHDVTAESSRTRLVQIGEMVGPVIRLPAAALRSSGLEVMGSGGGSIPPTGRCPSPTSSRRGNVRTWAAAGWCSSFEPLGG